MKILLACLMCLVLTTSQTFAIKGGPFGGNSHVTTTGIYAGLFVPVSDPNSLGLFSVTIPRRGLGTGAVALFRNGLFYPGTIQAEADPDSAKLVGVVNASFSVTFISSADPTTHITTTIVVTYNANGGIKGKMQANTTVMSVASVRIRGTASLTFAAIGDDSTAANSGGPVAYKMRGFKQAEGTQ